MRGQNGRRVPFPERHDRGQVLELMNGVFVVVMVA